jgi:hypothetical protein
MMKFKFDYKCLAWLIIPILFTVWSAQLEASGYINDITMKAQQAKIMLNHSHRFGLSQTEISVGGSIIFISPILYIIAFPFDAHPGFYSHTVAAEQSFNILKTYENPVR